MNRFLKRIDEIIPIDLFLLLNFSIIIGCLIDFDLIDFRYLIINIVWITIFSLPSIFFKTTIPTKIGAAIFFIVGFIETTHWILINGPITVVSLLTVGATNFQESIEFVSIKSSFLLILLIPYLLLFIYSLRKKREYNYYKGKNIVIVLVAVISISFISENAINGRLVRKGVPQTFKVFFSFNDQYDFFKKTETNITAREVEACLQDGENKTFVLIIGESLNRNHMSLYNYNRITSPKLEKRDDLFVFKDVVSAYSNTINSILSILSEASLENNKKQEECIDLFDIFSSAGFKTYWLSNQPPYGIWENRVTTLAKKSDKYRFVNLASNSSMEATQTTSYDKKLFFPLENILSSDESNKFIVVHLMGNHTSYKKRYPNSFNIFKGSAKEEKIIAQYDNSVLYNDYIVDSLLNIISYYSGLNNEITSVIYLSDHGENVYDYSGQVGHTYSGKLPKSNVEIPFLVWLSDDYKTKYSIELLEIQNSTEKPYVTDDLFHGILDINNIETPYFNSEKSLFNKGFNEKRKRILVDKNDYDN